MPKKRTFYSEEERKAHHEKKQREADLQIQELTKHWENDPKDIAEYLAFSTQFYKYSSRNTMLIYRQRPDSVFIASYTHWKELGYYVQEGEHGANIYRPETTRYFKPNVPNPTWVLLSKASPEQRHEVEIGMLESRDFTYFKPCTVFDISQTNCPPEDYPKLCGVGYNSTQHKDIYNTLCLYSEEIGVPVSEEDFEGIGTRGTYNPLNKHIHINQLLGDTQKLDTLLHEMSHHLMGHSPNIEKPTMQREFEADGLSIMFGKTFGIEPSDARKSHLAACYQELLKAQPEVKIDALLAPVREKFQQHIEAMEQELSLAGVILQQIISSQKAAELKREQAMKKEPTVTVIWTESKRLHDGQTMRLSRANELFKAIDKAQQKYPNCYHKAAFRIDYMLHGEPSSYEGRQSFGTGEGSLIDHIKRLNTLCNENPQWENYLLETGGSDALLQDRHEKEYILNEFIPYLNLHVTGVFDLKRKTTCAKLDINLTTYTRALRTLIEKELVSVKHRTRGGQQITSHIQPRMEGFKLRFPRYLISELRDTAFLVYVELLNRCGKESWSLSRRVLAKKFHCSALTISRAIRQLKERNLIDAVPDYDRQGINRFRALSLHERVARLKRQHSRTMLFFYQMHKLRARTQETAYSCPEAPLCVFPFCSTLIIYAPALSYTPLF